MTCDLCHGSATRTVIVDGKAEAVPCPVCRPRVSQSAPSDRRETLGVDVRVTTGANAEPAGGMIGNVS